MREIDIYDGSLACIRDRIISRLQNSKMRGKAKHCSAYAGVSKKEPQRCDLTIHLLMAGKWMKWFAKKIWNFGCRRIRMLITDHVIIIKWKKYNIYVRENNRNEVKRLPWPFLFPILAMISGTLSVVSSVPLYARIPVALLLEPKQVWKFWKEMNNSRWFSNSDSPLSNSS